jgi:hypothetical protein
MGNTKHFKGTSGGWSIMFSLCKKLKEVSDSYSKKTLAHYIDVDNDNNIIGTEDKVLYIPETKASEWIRRFSNRQSLINPPITLSMPTNLKKLENRNGKICGNSLGFLVNDGNTVFTSLKGSAILSTSFSNGHGLSINDNNFGPCNVLFTARRTSYIHKLDNEDQYLEPDTTHPKYTDFENNAVVFSIFDNQSLQSSLRNVGYTSDGEPINYPTSDIKGDVNIYNQYFFMSQKEILELSKEHFEECYYDCVNDVDRYTYLKIESLIENNLLSNEALDVLNAGRKLIRETFSIRKALHDNYPEYHLNAWDAGYWQIRMALKREGLTPMLQDLKVKQRILKEKLKPNVYDLGFLYPPII